MQSKEMHKDLKDFEAAMEICAMASAMADDVRRLNPGACPDVAPDDSIEMFLDLMAGNK